MGVVQIISAIFLKQIEEICLEQKINLNRSQAVIPGDQVKHQVLSHGTAFKRKAQTPGINKRKVQTQTPGKNKVILKLLRKKLKP